MECICKRSPLTQTYIILSDSYNGHLSLALHGRFSQRSPPQDQLSDRKIKAAVGIETGASGIES